MFVDILMKNYTSTTKTKTRGWIGMGIVFDADGVYPFLFVSKANKKNNGLLDNIFMPFKDALYSMWQEDFQIMIVTD